MLACLFPSSLLRVGDHFVHQRRYAVISKPRIRLTLLPVPRQLEHSATDLFDQSLISSVHLRMGLPRLLFPLILPSSISVHRFLALTTWPKYWSLRLSTVASSRSWGCISCSTDVLVRCVAQLTLNNRRYAVISKPRIRLTPTAFSLQFSHLYSATVHTKVDKSLCLTLACKDLSFHKESRGLTAPPAASSLACISLLQSPFSVIIAPRYLNVSTCSSSFCGVLVISFVFFVLISSPYSLETTSTLSNNVCRACGDCAVEHYIIRISQVVYCASTERHSNPRQTICWFSHYVFRIAVEWNRRYKHPWLTPFFIANQPDRDPSTLTDACCPSYSLCITLTFCSFIPIFLSISRESKAIL